MTATPETGDIERDKALLEMFDHQVFTVDRAAASNRLVPAKVIMLPDTDPGVGQLVDSEIERLLPLRRHQFRFTKNAPDEHEIYRMCAWQAVVDIGIIRNSARNTAAIKKAILHANDSVIVLVNTVEHAQEIAKLIPGAIPCFSKMGRKARAKSIERFRGGDCKCVMRLLALLQSIRHPPGTNLGGAGFGAENDVESHRHDASFPGTGGSTNQRFAPF
jgi:superfamily II DNA or RNA helicase